MKSTSILTAAAISICITSFGILPAQAGKPDKMAKQVAINDVVKKQPRRERSRPREDMGELTAKGKELEKLYSETFKSLKADIASELPEIDASKKTACLEALQALIAAEENAKSKAHAHNLAICNHENDLKRDTKLLEAIPGNTAAAELLLKRAMAMPDGHELKPLAMEEAQAALAKYRDSQEFANKLESQNKMRMGVLEKNRLNEPELIKAIELANEEVTQAKAKAYKAVDALGLDGLLGGDKLDAKHAAYVVFAEATPTDLARYAQQGPEQEKRITALLKDKDLMVQMLVADGPYWQKFGPALEIYEAIQKASPKAKEGVFQRLAMAVSLQHAVPMSNVDEESEEDERAEMVFIDPVKRYLSYEKAYLDGELDAGFKDLSTWEMKMLVDGNEPLEIAEWGRKMLRNYRPDLVTMDDTAWRYVMSVNTEINYTSKYQKLGWDDPKLNNYQNILANGGICGRRAFFGRFILRSFGIPATRRPQRGHAALVRWTPEGWVPCLGGGWGCSRGPIFQRYAKDIDFHISSQARKDANAFMRVKRAQWIGDVLGEARAFGYTLETPEFWYAVSLLEQNRIIDRLQAKELVTVGEDLGEAEDSALGNSAAYEIPAADRKITVDGKGVITIPAAACSSPTNSTDVVLFMPSNLGGTQLHYTRYGTTDTFSYQVDAPKAGKYHLTARLVTPAPKQHLYLSINGGGEIDMALPYTVGLWGSTEPVKVELSKGSNVLTFSRAHFFMRGVSIRDFTLTPVE